MDKNTFIKLTDAEYISSRQNPRVVQYSSLKDEKARKAEALFLAEGVKLTKEALRHAEVRNVLVSESCLEGTPDEEILSFAKDGKVRFTLLSDTAFEKISTEKAPQGVIAVVKNMAELHFGRNFTEWQKNKRIIMLDEIRDPGNLGTVIRSAEALGVDGVVLSGCADIYNPKTVRAAMGALFRMPIFAVTDTVSTIRDMRLLGRRVIGATLGENTVTLGEYKTDRSDCIIIGNEGHGISDEAVKACDMCVRIPMAGETESLNASAAAVCIMWEYFRNER